LQRPEGIGTWTYFAIPFDVKKVFGATSRVQVKGMVDGSPFKSTLLPKGDGTHFMVVNKEIRDAIGKSAGDRVKVTMEIDTSARTVIVPKDLERALKQNSMAREFFNRLPYSHKKQYVDWIESAKKSDTRQNRIRKAIDMLTHSMKTK
jgi:hypothetical protein